MEINLDTPLELPCGLVIPNRIAKAAMTTCLADELSRPTKETFRLYELWSKGGSGLLITGNLQVDRRYLTRPGNHCIDGKLSDQDIQLWKQYALAGQKYNNSKIFAQISHAGRQSTGMVNMDPIGPSNVPLKVVPKYVIGHPTAMSLDDIMDVKERFINAVLVCQECGFNGVQIHAAHGYLLSSFMNPIANIRKDQYGGSLENRSRLLIEIVTEVKKIAKKGFAISVKLNSADYQNGGFSTDECVKVALMLQDIGIDLLEISGGNYDSMIFKENETIVDDGSSLHAELDDIINKNDLKKSTALREAYYLKYSRDIIEALKDNNNNNENNVYWWI